MAAHTAGPWKAERCSDAIEIGAETPAGHLSVAWIHLGDGPHKKTDVEAAWADAHLLEAAPDLLGACERALAHVTHEETTTASEPTKDAMRGIATFLRAAIAKARATPTTTKES